MSGYLGNIRNDYNSYRRLINFYHSNKNKFSESINIKLDWFPANTCSMLGALLSLLQDNLNTIGIDPKRSGNILERNGFLAFFGHRKLTDFYNTTISYQVLNPEDDRYFNNYVFKEFLSKPDLPAMTNALKKKLAESIYEIFINAKMHSGTDRIFTCGQFYPAKKKIEFMITDLGIGIREVINRRFKSNLTAIQAIEWAMIEGNTTKEGVSGGIGFALLKEFIEKNKGVIQIISNEGFWELNQNEISKASFEQEFPGTAINISVSTDDSAHYSLIGELSDNIF